MRNNYSKIKFSKKLNKYTYYYRGCYRTSQGIENKRKKVIGGFDGYERFLYFESGTYSWPKSNSVKPYTQYSTTSSEALTWLGSNEGNSSYYGGQLYSSSKFDNQNIYNLEKIIPEYIKNNTD